MLEDIEYIESNVCKLAKSKVTCFSSKKERFTGRLLFHSTKAGDHVLSMLAIPVEEIVRQYPLHKFNPYVDAFIRCLDLYFPHRLPWWLDLRSDQDVLDAVELLNRLVTSIRVEVNNAEFVKELAKSERATNKNFRELMKYTDALFDVCARMLVLRIDLSYRNMYSGHDGAEREVSYEDVRSHREVLFSYLKKDALRDCFVGYAWKLEYGLDKGYHYHVLLFLDGSKVREDVTITKVIGEHWKNEITGGKGLYYNCNAMKRAYRFCGIGMISYSDLDLRNNLRKAAIYLTKTDYYKRIVVPGNDRSFGKGIMPRKPGIKRGRPRSA